MKKLEVRRGVMRADFKQKRESILIVWSNLFCDEDVRIFFVEFHVLLQRMG